MGLNTGIEWTNHTLNPWNGCIKVGGDDQECAICYAADTDKRNLHQDGTHWGHGSKRLLIKSWVSILNRARKSAIANNRRETVFCMSMGDIFEVSKPLSKNEKSKWNNTSEVRDELFRMIPDYPELIFLLLTKRPELIMRTIPDSWLIDWPENVWIGTSIGLPENVRRTRYLRMAKAKGAKTFVSAEPLIGPVVFGEALDGIDWLIAGGESEMSFSSGKARPMNPDWARSLRDECAVKGIPFFFKQWGEHDQYGKKVGKVAAGKALDGEILQAFPPEFHTPIKAEVTV